MDIKQEFREDLLFTALNKYYKPLTWDDYLDMDMQDIYNAIYFSGMPKEVVDAIWPKKHKPFEVFS